MDSSAVVAGASGSTRRARFAPALQIDADQDGTFRRTRGHCATPLHFPGLAGLAQNSDVPARWRAHRVHPAAAATSVERTRHDHRGDCVLEDQLFLIVGFQDYRVLSKLLIRPDSFTPLIR